MINFYSHGVKKGSTLFLGDLAVFATEESITELFAPFGEILEVIIKSSPDRKVKLGYGFIRFSNHTAALSAQRQMNGVMHKGRAMHVDWASSKLKHRGAETVLQVLVSFIGKSANKDNFVSEELLRGIFSKHGPVVDTTIKKISIDEASNYQTGYGFISFSNTAEGMRAAMYVMNTLNDTVIEDIAYDCRPSESLKLIIKQQEQQQQQGPIHQGGYMQSALVTPPQNCPVISPLASSASPMVTYSTTAVNTACGHGVGLVSPSMGTFMSPCSFYAPFPSSYNPSPIANHAHIPQQQMLQQPLHPPPQPNQYHAQSPSSIFPNMFVGNSCDSNDGDFGTTPLYPQAHAQAQAQGFYSSPWPQQSVYPHNMQQQSVYPNNMQQPQSVYPNNMQQPQSAYPNNMQQQSVYPNNMQQQSVYPNNMQQPSPSHGAPVHTSGHYEQRMRQSYVQQQQAFYNSPRWDDAAASPHTSVSHPHPHYHYGYAPAAVAAAYSAVTAACAYNAPTVEAPRLLLKDKRNYRAAAEHCTGPGEYYDADDATADYSGTEDDCAASEITTTV